ncbi:hypothetical protein [Plantactinospora sp. B5E13]|uniref:hypothetical protein n=1 Tax=unclassified Plantactinospora TaxID=2631981 RepID=UPI00325E6B27
MPEDKSEIRVVRDAFDIESEKWTGLAKDMAGLKTTASGLDLSALAFFCGNPLTAKQLGDAYTDIHELIKTLMAAGEEEFHELSRALIIARDLYDGSDRTSASDFVKIYGEHQ